MIARTWHGETDASRADEYLAYLNATGVRDLRATRGNIAVFVLRRIEGDRAHFTFVSLWESLDAIRAFAGDEAERARYYPEDAKYLLTLEPLVQHHDVVVSRQSA